MFPTEYQHFVHLSRYARWLPSENRRETWVETVGRYQEFMNDVAAKVGIEFPQRVYDDILNFRAMPSMRCLMSAGRSLARDHMAGYNCSFINIDHPRAFDEALYTLCCGTGVGFSVERQHVQKLLTVPEAFEKTDTVISVRDSKRGWAEALRELIAMLYAGRVPGWDTSKVRRAGTPLKTSGGRASGPEPLERLFKFVVDTFLNASGRKLTSLECHDILCMIGECIVAGGVRRSALLSLSNLSDQRMRDAKSGRWWDQNPQRAMANNSVAYTEKPDVGQFMTEWLALYTSKSGERGIFNRKAAREQATRFGRRKSKYDNGQDIDFGLNPCSEIILRPQQTCNLSTVVARKDDTFESLAEKVVSATILGTLQATLTNFRYVRSEWKRNCEEERLLGVSISGIMDCPLINHVSKEASELLSELRQVAVDTNKEWAGYLGINPATAITCVKPEGTLSQLVDSSSGIHTRHSPFYLRRVRQNKKDPLTKLMIDVCFPNEADVMNSNDVVFTFPIRSPEGSVCRKDITAIEQLNHWKMVQDFWCEHKPSITVSVRENEWPEVGAWVWNNFDSMSGVSFLPYGDHSYRQAPYEEVSESELKAFEETMPNNVDWSALSDYEKEDRTTASREFACSAGGVCEI